MRDMFKTITSTLTWWCWIAMIVTVTVIYGHRGEQAYPDAEMRAAAGFLLVLLPILIASDLFRTRRRRSDGGGGR